MSKLPSLSVAHNLLHACPLLIFAPESLIDFISLLSASQPLLSFLLPYNFWPIVTVGILMIFSASFQIWCFLLTI